MHYAISASPERVEAWSERRLPFEPKGWLLEFRNDLRAAVRGLNKRGSTLFARYTSDDQNSVDVENVLLYNLGTSCLGQLARQAITFERSFAMPALNNYGHHVLYSVEEPSPSPSWNEYVSLGDWSVPLKGRIDLYSTWLAVKQSGSTFTPQGEPSQFSLSLTVVHPDWQRLNASVLLKGVFDSAISALHTYNGNRLDEVGRRIGRRLTISESLARTLLLDKSQCSLGPREVVWPRGDGVQWNPADHLCVHGSLRLEQGPEPLLRGSLRLATAAIGV